MDEGRATQMQMQVKRNAEDLQNYLKDLDSWEDGIKKKDEGLSRRKPILKEQLPPVRGSEKKEKRRKKKKPAAPATAKSKRITSYDYDAWSKFDVDKACEDVDFEVQSTDSSSEEEEEEEVVEDEEEDEMQRKQRAVMEKEKGNVLFRKGAHAQAVERYGVAMQLDPSSAILPANRAMALLKLDRYAAAEADCTTALELDHTYLKAYLRRGTARLKLGKPQLARQDFESVLELEADHKMAKSELEKLDKELGTSGQRYIRAVKRPPHLRSKKPLKRILVQDTGVVAPDNTSSSHQVPETAPSTSSSSTANTSTSVSQSPMATDSDSSAPSTPQVSLISEISSTPSSHVDLRGQTSHSHDNSALLDGTEHARSDIVTVGSVVDSKMSLLLNEETSKGGEVGIAPSGRGVAGGRGKDTVEVPSVPQSSIQFQADWRQVSAHGGSRVQYFKSIPVSRYPVVLKQSLETDVFSDIIQILHTSYVKCGVKCLEELGWLAKVPRFSVAVMFLSRQQKEGLAVLFRDLMELVSEDEQEKAAVQDLARTFSIS